MWFPTQKTAGFGARPFSPSRRLQSGFTLAEIMVATTILVIVMSILLQAISSMQKVTSVSTGTLVSFQEARFAYGEITRKLSKATLNTYWDYDSTTTPTKYQRASELHFFCGATGGYALFNSDPSYPTHCLFFEAPLGKAQSSSYRGLDDLLNACGFYVQFGGDSNMPSFLSSLVPQRWRFRLLEWQPPSEKLNIYAFTSGNPAYDLTGWIDLAASGSSRVLADNVVALIVLPKLSRQEDPSGAQLSANYAYDSRAPAATNPGRNQLPPLVQVVMVAIDEPSAAKLAKRNGSAMPPLIPGSLFKNSAQLQADLAALESILSAAPGNAAGNTMPLNYIVMNSDVSIHASKWSAF